LDAASAAMDAASAAMDAASAAMDAASAAMDAASAAMDAASDKDEIMTLVAECAVQALIVCKSPGCKWLNIVEAK